MSMSNAVNPGQKTKEIKIMLMKSESYRHCILVLMVAVLSCPLAAQAAKMVADADFVSTSNDGCTDTEVNVFVKRGKKSGLKKVKLILSITQTDECRGRVLLSVKSKKQLKAGEFTVRDGKVVLNTTVGMRERRTRKKHKVKVFVQWFADASYVTGDVSRDIDEPGKFVKTAGKRRKTLCLCQAIGYIAQGTKVIIEGPAEESSFAITE